MSETPRKARSLALATEQADKTTQREVSLLRVVKSADGEGAGETRSVANPWEGAEVNDIVEPPFDLLGLSMLAEQNSELGQTIEAMEVNVSGYGWRLKRDLHAVDPSLDEIARVELERFQDFLLHANYDGGSLTMLRRMLRRDLELTGNAYLEVIRDDSGQICALKHLPSYLMRLRILEAEPVEVVERRPVGRGAARRWQEYPMRRRFRSFVQARLGYAKDEPQTVFFRQYGDPRPRLWETGDVVTDEMREAFAAKGQEIPGSMLATEVLHFTLYSSRSPYGVPRYIGNLLAIMGGRAAEEINYTTFKNNNIPSMAILVSNGMLTDGSVERITQFVETTIQGSDNFSKFLVIEAEGVEEGTEGQQVKLDIKPLTREQHTDELFQHYGKNNEDRIRRAFRLPPIFVGRSDDYTRATADTSRKLADEQVFAPERDEEDHAFNKLLRDMGMLYHTFQTNSPNITNDQDLIAVLTGAEKAGGTTPRIARLILEDILGRDLGPISSKIEADVPFSLQMADAVKNKAPANEPGAQVTALKALEALEELGIVEADSPVVELVKARQKAPRAPENTAIGVGAQAYLAADGALRAIVTDVHAKLAGRTLFLGDGHDLLAKATFGETRRLPRAEAAKAAGLLLEDLAGIHPTRSHLYVHALKKVEALEAPLSYVQPDDSLFATKAIEYTAPESTELFAPAPGPNLSSTQMSEILERVQALHSVAPARVSVISRAEARRLGTPSPWGRAASIAELLDRPPSDWTPVQARLHSESVEKIEAMKSADLDDPAIIGLVLHGYAHPELANALRRAEESLAPGRG